MVTAEGVSGRLYTHQTENVCADPPSKPASQDMLACFTPGETDREVAAWGLVPVTQRSRWNSSSSSTTACFQSIEAISWCATFNCRRRIGGRGFKSATGAKENNGNKKKFGRNGKKIPFLFERAGKLDRHLKEHVFKSKKFLRNKQKKHFKRNWLLHPVAQYSSFIHHWPRTKTRVLVFTAATRLAATHSHAPWWSFVRGCRSREPLASTEYDVRRTKSTCREWNAPMCNSSNLCTKIAAF